MKYFFSLALIGLFFSLSAQETITYPYNPDSDNDQYVAVSDVLSSISAFGAEFLPTEIQIDGQELSVIISQIQSDITVLQLENSALSDTLITLQEQILLLLNSLATSISEIQNVCANCCDANGNGQIVDVDSDGIDDSVDSCIDQTACNYAADPTEDCYVLDAINVCGGLCAADNDGDGLCDEIPVLGCMDATACNYNPDATVSNDECFVCDDGNSCTNDSCVNGECVFVPNNGPCDDGNACTFNAVCAWGTCQGQTMVCDDGDPCTNDFCNGGVCEYIPIICDDGDANTYDACVDGACEYIPVILCGNGILELGEECDDGNNVYGDGCDGCVIVIVNTPPIVSQVVITPNAPVVGNTLVCTYLFTDADGDADQSTLSWYVDGNLVGSGDTLSYAFSIGTVVKCYVAPFDGTDYGVAVTATVIIQ